MYLTEEKKTKGPYLYECQEDISWQAPSSDRFIFLRLGENQMQNINR